MTTTNHLVNASLGSPKDNHKDLMPIDLNDVEMVFGTPSSPRGPVKPDVHHITNERKPEKDTNGHPHKPDGGIEKPSLQPLLEPDKEKPKPPLAGPEIDDLDDARPTDATPYPGIDDGLFEPIDKTEHHEGRGTEGEGSHHSHETHPTRDDGVGTDDGKWPWPPTDEADYPYDGFNGLSPRFGIDDRPGSPLSPGTSIPDVNTYQQKKNLAQGMMDLALLSANANQLRYVLESAASHPYYYPSLAFISLSIVFQIAVGIGLIMNSRYNVKDEKDICKADKINNMTVLGVFLITIVNVFITSFSVASPTTTVGIGTQVAATSIPDVNTYQQKKKLAQGMMDLALLSANANQLRYVLESAASHPYYYPSLAFISLSIVFQIAVGIGLIMNSRYNVKDEKDICKADKINNMTVLGVFLITIVNVFITSFSVASPTTTVGIGTQAAAIQPSG